MINLISRYGDKHYLEKIEDKVYKLIIKGEGFLRVGLTESNDNNNYQFIDPPGGPFICVNGILPVVNAKVKSINYVNDKGYLITVE